MPPLPLSLRVLRVLAKKPASIPTLARETGALEGDVKRELDKHLAAGRVSVSGTSWMLTKEGLAFSRNGGAPSKASEPKADAGSEHTKQMEREATKGAVERVAKAVARSAVKEAEKAAKLVATAVTRVAVEEARRTAAARPRPRRKPKRGALAVPEGPSPEALAIKMQLVERGLWPVVEDVAKKHGEDPMGLVESQWSRNKVVARSEMFARVLVFEGRRYSKSEVAQMFGRDESVVRDGVRRWAQMQKKTGEAA